MQTRAQSSLHIHGRRPNHILEVQSSLGQHLAMNQRPLHALLIHIPVFRDTAQLPLQNSVEPVHMLFSPLDTRRHHDHGKTLLVDQSGVFDDVEVDEGDLIDVQVEIALENALSGLMLVHTSETRTRKPTEYASSRSRCVLQGMRHERGLRTQAARASQHVFSSRSSTTVFP